MIPYSLTDHIHEREISKHCTPVSFVPHVGAWFQGISLTINVPISQGLTSRDIRHLYQDYYSAEELVKISGDIPLVKSIAGKIGLMLVDLLLIVPVIELLLLQPLIIY